MSVDSAMFRYSEPMLTLGWYTYGFLMQLSLRSHASILGMWRIRGVGKNFVAISDLSLIVKMAMTRAPIGMSGGAQE